MLWHTVVGMLVLPLLLCCAAGPARADLVELSTLSVARSEEGVVLSFAAQFDLPHAVEDALIKGVPLHFVAEADVYRSRWYWRDVRVSRAIRSWRLTYQPLTRKFRVGVAGLDQTFDTLPEALAVLRASTRWKVADLGQVEDDGRHYVEFSYRLDTTQLPRPMQIGFGAQPEWNLSIERTVRLD
jgi:hypothetical protein